MRRRSKEWAQEECYAHGGKRNGEKQAIFKCQINRTGSLCFLVISIAEFAILKKEPDYENNCSKAYEKLLLNCSRIYKLPTYLLTSVRYSLCIVKCPILSVWLDEF